MLLGSCCFLLKYHQKQIKTKGKRTWVWEIFKKKIEQGVYHNFLRRCVSMIENQVSGNNLLPNVTRKNLRLFLFIKILLSMLNYSPSISLLIYLFVSFISFSINARVLLHFPSQAFSILYTFFPFYFVFINALITSH